MANYLKRSRHGTTFYFRRRVPDELRQTVGQPYLTKSLETSDRREAIMRARLLAAKTDILFADFRAMPRKARPSTALQIDYALSLDISPSGKKRAVALDVQPGEEVSAAVAVAALQAHVDGAPLPASIPAVGSSGSKEDKTLLQAWEGYEAEKIAAKAWRDGEDTAKYDHWPHVRRLIEVVGDKPLTSITADDINEFQNHVLTDPKGGTPRNRDKRLTRSGAVLRWAKKKRLIGDDFAELFRYPGKIEENPYVAFDLNDLKALFESADYRDQTFRTPSEFWLPILGLYTGARLNELCQLTASDIGMHDEVETISILDEDIGKRLKTTASRRIVPIHSKLIALGFLDYASTIKTGRIFPELPEDPARPGSFGAKPSELFTAYRRKHGVGKIKERSNKAFHSFRSTLISALRKAEVPKDRRTRLGGHEYDDTQDKNYHGGDVLTMFDFRTLKADIETVRYDVDFTAYRP